MTFLNPRPATGSLPYPWRYNGETVGHIIKLPIPLTYEELMAGSQIVVSGVTETINVIEGDVTGSHIEFRAGGLLIARVTRYDGASDLVTIVIMEDFAGEIIAVNFDKAYKNLPEGPSLDAGSGDTVSYYDGDDIIARCTLNNVVISEVANYIPSNGLLGNLVFQSKYIQDYGNVIEANYWTNGRYLYVLRLDDGYQMKAVIRDNTESPLQFPIL